MFNFFKRKALTLEITFHIEKDGQVYFAYSPTFPGLNVEGDTEDEALENAKDAAIAYIRSLIKHNDPLPVCADQKNHDYSRNQTVRKNIRVPAFV